MKIGTRVRLTQDVDNYPTCLIRTGETGTLMRITDDGTYGIKLDHHHPGLDEWDNELEIWDWSVRWVNRALSKLTDMSFALIADTTLSPLAVVTCSNLTGLLQYFVHSSIGNSTNTSQPGPATRA